VPITPPKTSWTEPGFVVRVAGMPIDVLDRLRAHRTLAGLEEVLDIERWLDERRDALCDALHGLVGGNDDTASRRRLIALRRDIHLARLPRTRPDAAAFPEMPSALAADVADWYERLVRRRDALARAESELAAEALEVRCALKEIARDVNLRHGLVQASPSLYVTLDRWLASTEPPRADRKFERRLAKYISRTATKTSPYSTFTSSGEGRWSTGDAAVHCASRSAGGALASRRSIVELNAFLQRQILRSVAMLPELRPQTRLAVNTSLVDTGSVLRFLGKQEHEAVIELGASATLRSIVDEVRHGEGGTYGGLLERLSRGDGGQRTAEIVRFVDRLIGLGLLEVSLDIADCADDKLALLARELRRVGGPRLDALADLVTALRGELAGYAATAIPADRFAGARAIEQAFGRLCAALGWELRGDDLPKHPFYEDTLLPDAAIECSGRAWSAVLGDLELVQRLAGAFDRFLPGRLAAAAFFEDHHGAGATVPFLEFYGEFCREIRQPAGWRADHRISGADLLTCYERPHPVPQVGLERLAVLAELQRRLTAWFAALPIARGVRRASPAEIRELLAGFPSFVPPIESTGFHCQVIAVDARVQVVLNELVMGFGRSRARLVRLDEMSGGGVFAPSGPPGERDAASRRHAEVAGAMGSNLNLRRPAAAKQDDRSGSMLSSVAVITFAVAATGGLIYGGATCDFPGCKVVFGGPLLLLGGAALFTLGRD